LKKTATYLTRALSVVVLALGLAATGAFTLAVSADETAPKTVTCEEKVPAGSTRPTIKEKFPGTATAGYEAVLELTISHGKGETPLPSGFRITAGSDVDKNLTEAGFLPGEPDAGGTSSMVTVTDGEEATTTVKIPFVVAPLKSGTRSLTLPRMPLTIGRANGERMIVCTQLHLLVASDPTADEKDPKPHANPAGRPQFEDWPLIKQLLIAGLILLVVLSLLAWWVRRQMKKPVPGREGIQLTPWEAALVELDKLKSSPLLVDVLDRPAGTGETETEARGELFDRVSDTVRKYLGARYGFEGLGFDGLETTTGEMMTLLRRVRPGVPGLDGVNVFLSECDLVKFAKVEPRVSDCALALDRAEAIVRATIPIALPAASAPTAGGQSAVTVPAKPPPAAPAPPPPPPPPPEVSP